MRASGQKRNKARTDCRFVQALAFVQEMCNVLGVHLQQVILAQVLDACVVDSGYIVIDKIVYYADYGKIRLTDFPQNTIIN